ncbi:hypothetical protein [Anaerocolumna xylanovorans]|uniref:Uncharacterized protein n=1 Tax=Anaerocolumna xylanovorans DSM 12503 TaxID=1121345 RepID=A0A1M7Y3Y8_9FIRM|nr:hypothetical protein [Anaerocolumna xylanovorans]SHO46791.1 hypothetical protein SAMN02745217_01290 [Anaerocolumna xylanovorans DSM 12503]
MIDKDIFTDEVVYAILKRKPEINRTYIVLSKLMKMYDMETYASAAENRILDSESIGYAIEKDHVVLDVFEKDIWLDEVALHRFSYILEGYISESSYDKFLDYVGSLEHTRRIHNQALEMYQGKSLKGLISHVVEHRKYKNTFPSEFEMICYWCKLELLSRTPFPRLYYFFKELPDRLRFNYLKQALHKAFPESKTGKKVQS